MTSGQLLSSIPSISVVTDSPLAHSNLLYVPVGIIVEYAGSVL